MRGDNIKAVFGADASTTRDSTALVGVYYDLPTQLYHVVFCRIWKPQASVRKGGKPFIDLNETIGAEILRLHNNRQVLSFYYDPWQLSSIATILEENGVRMVEFPQTAQRTEADQLLYDGIINGKLRHSNNSQLNEHIYNAVALDTPRGFRLKKDKASKPIDAAVALSMAYYGARDQRPSNYIESLKSMVLKKLTHPEVPSETIMKRLDQKMLKDLNDFNRQNSMRNFLRIEL